MLNFRQAEVFRAVMIARTVSGAARTLNTSQPGLSRMLKHMESRLGLVLFDRSGGRLAPTREAVALFERMQDVYQGLEALSGVIEQLQRGEDLTFRVGASPSVGYAFMPRALSDLRKRHPRLRLHFDTLSVSQVVDYLALGQGQYALTVFELDHPNITSEKLGAAGMVCVLPPRHRLSASAAPLQLAEIAEDPLVSFEADTPHGAAVRQMFSDAGLAREVAILVRFAETACEFVEQGAGVALVDEFTAKRWAHPLRTRHVEGATALPIMLHHSRALARSGLGEAFEAILRSLVAEATAS